MEPSPKDRKHWAEVVRKKGTREYVSFIHNPHTFMLKTIGTFPTAYEAAKARHMEIRRMPPHMAVSIVNDFIPDPSDTEYFKSIGMWTNTNTPIPPPIFESIHLNNNMGPTPPVHMPYNIYNHFDRYGKPYTIKHNQENVYNNYMRARLEQIYPHMYNRTIHHEPFTQGGKRRRSTRRSQKKRKTTRRIRKSDK
jgi:hypothetical protein